MERRGSRSIICAVLGAGLALLLGGLAMADVDPFSARALLGVHRVNVRIDGIPNDFERYGLTAQKLRDATERRLRDNGIDVVSEAVAVADPDASQLNVKLYANEDSYSLYAYRISVVLRRKIPLDRDGQAFIAQSVWSNGQSGVLNPSDLSRVYGFVGTLLDQFLSDHGQHNSDGRNASGPN